MLEKSDFIVSDRHKIRILETISNKEGISKSGIKSSLRMGHKTLTPALSFLKMIGAIEGIGVKEDNRGKIGFHITDLGKMILFNVKHPSKKDLSYPLTDEGNKTLSDDLERLVKILERYMGVAGLGHISIEIIENCIWEWEREKGHKRKEAIRLLAKQLSKIYDYFQDNPEAIRIYVKILLTVAEDRQ